MMSVKITRVHPILTNIFSSERLASQQFKNIGINKFRIGGHNIYRSTEKQRKIVAE